VLKLHETLIKCTKPKVISQAPQAPAQGRMPRGQEYFKFLTSVTAALRCRRVCDEAILACLTVINQRQCEEPKPAADLRKLVQETRKRRLRA
jgi:hypothetical protein